MIIVSIVISCSTNSGRLSCCETDISGHCCCKDRNGYPHLIRNCRKRQSFYPLMLVVCRRVLDVKKKFGILNCNGCQNGFKC